MPTQAQIAAFQRGFSYAVTELAKQASTQNPDLNAWWASMHPPQSAQAAAPAIAPPAAARDGRMGQFMNAWPANPKPGMRPSAPANNDVGQVSKRWLSPAAPKPGMGTPAPANNAQTAPAKKWMSASSPGKRASVTKQAGPLAGIGSRIAANPMVRKGISGLGAWASDAKRAPWMRDALLGRANPTMGSLSHLPNASHYGPFSNWDQGLTAAKRIGVGAGAIGGTAAGVQGVNSAIDGAKQRQMAQMGFGDRLGMALKFLSNPEAASRMLY